MVYMIFICIIAPMLLMLFLLDKQPRTLVIFMIMGMLVCVCACEIDSGLYALSNMTQNDFTVYVTPICEEILKAMPVLFFALLISDKTKNIITVAISVGIGFAIMENMYFLVINYDNISFGWVFIRGFAVAVMHSICTATVGYGTVYIYKKKKLFYTGIFGLLCCAITYHSIYNMIVQTLYSYIAYIMPVVTYLIGIAVIKHKEIKSLIKRKNK